MLETAAALFAVGYLMKRASNGKVAYQNGQPVDVRLVFIDADGHQLEERAAEDFLRMREAAASEGVVLVVESAFRSWAAQASLYEQYTSGARSDLVAPPGYSAHQSGKAVDLDTDRGTNAAYRWLMANAHLFNFRRTVTSEPWHWEHRA